MRKNFFKDTGFYIALCACLAVIGAIAYVGNQTERPLNQKTSDNIEIVDSTTIPTKSPVITSPTTPPKATPIPKSTTEPVKSASKSITVIDATPAPTASPTSTPSPIPDIEFQMPLSGKVITTFSDGALIYNKDLDDWRSHDGIDIQAEVGTDVKAVADGKVIDISNTSLGKTVKIDHQNGYISIYSNLEDNINVSAEQNVKKGDTIGKVGKTTISEQFMEPHLHFELLENDKYVNPLDFVK